jgi:hypothetical protein
LGAERCGAGGEIGTKLYRCGRFRAYGLGVCGWAAKWKNEVDAGVGEYEFSAEFE